MTKTEAFKLLYDYRVPEGAIEAYQALELELAAKEKELESFRQDAERYRYAQQQGWVGEYVYGCDWLKKDDEAIDKDRKAS